MAGSPANGKMLGKIPVFKRLYKVVEIVEDIPE